MKNKNFGWGIVVVIILLLIIILPMLTGNSKYTDITYSEFKEKINSDEFNFVYVGGENCQDCDDMKPILNQIKEQYDVEILYLDFSKLSELEKSEMQALGTSGLGNAKEPTFIFTRYGEIVDTLNGKVSGYEEFEKAFLESYTEKDLFNKVNAKEFIDLFNGKEKAFLVIGQTQCSHCISFKKVLNKAIYNYKANIYYLEFDLLTDVDKRAVIALDDSLQKLGTPHTMITKKGKILDTIEGETTYPILLEKLQKNGFIKVETNE